MSFRIKCILISSATIIAILFIRRTFSCPDKFNSCIEYESDASKSCGNILNINIEDHLRFTPNINIIEDNNKTDGHTSINGKVRDFYNILIECLLLKIKLSLNLFSYDEVICQENKCKHFPNLYNVSSLFFFVLHSFNRFNALLDQTNFLKGSKVSLLYIVLLENSQDKDNNIYCSTGDERNLKGKFAPIFDKIWNMHKILEIHVYLPDFCQFPRTVKFDPLQTCGYQGDCTDRVIIIDESNFTKPLLRLTKNLQQYPLNVVFFNREPTLIQYPTKTLLDTYFSNDIKDTLFLAGVDGFLFGNLVKSLNFNPNFYETPDKMDYGKKHSNGSLSGTLKEVVMRQADVAINARFFRDYDTDGFAFTIPIVQAKFCLVSPKAKRIPAWYNILKAFEVNIWYLIIITTSILATSWWILKTKMKVNIERNKDRHHDYSALLDIALLILNKPLIPLPTLDGERIFLTVCLVFNILLVGIYQGYLTTAYTKITFYKDINTLQEAYDSGMRVVASMDDIFGYNISTLMDNLRSRIFIKDLASLNDVEPLQMLALERDTDAKMLIEKKFMASDGQPRLHIVQECPRSYYLNYIVHDEFPFLEQINYFIDIAKSSGLSDKWYDITEFSLLLKYKLNYVYDTGFKTLSLTDVQSIFYCLIIGLSTSFVTFIFEVINHKLKLNQ